MRSTVPLNETPGSPLSLSVLVPRHATDPRHIILNCIGIPRIGSQEVSKGHPCTSSGSLHTTRNIYISGKRGAARPRWWRVSEGGGPISALESILMRETSTNGGLAQGSIVWNEVRRSGSLVKTSAFSSQYFWRFRSKVGRN